MAHRPGTPECVELGRIMPRGGLGWEALARLLRQKPWMLALVPFWAMGGRRALGRALARHVKLDASTLLYDAACLAELRARESAGERLVLVTDGSPELARIVAAHLAIFDEVRQGKDVSRTRSGGGWRAVLAALRIPQWAKNVLGFAPLITSHEIFHAALVGRCALAMALFGVCSSAQYLVNDLVDLEADRRHPWKRLRPFASGRLGLGAGFALAPVLFAIALAGAWMLSPAFALTLAVYAVAAISYSLYFKKSALLDVFVLSGLLLLRIVAGQLVTGVVYSVWLLSFAFFLLLSLAFAKRCAELSKAREGESVAGRGYTASDRTQVNLFGVSSGFLAAVVFMLYLQSERVRELYRAPDFLWLMAPLFLYWITRVWMLSARGSIDEDPVMFALQDRPTWWVAVLAALVMALAGAKSWSGHP